MGFVLRNLFKASLEQDQSTHEELATLHQRIVHDKAMGFCGEASNALSLLYTALEKMTSPQASSLFSAPEKITAINAKKLDETCSFLRDFTRVASSHTVAAQVAQGYYQDFCSKKNSLNR